MERGKGTGKALFAIIQAAGWPIWFLLAASIIAVALIIERGVSLRAAKIIPPRLFDQVVEVYRRQGVSEEVLERLANMAGFVGQPMTRADVERKFRSNVGKRWPAERTAAILQTLWALDRTEDVRGLLGGLSLQA